MSLPNAEALVHALQRLPPREAQLLTLRFVEGAGLEGVSRAYGISAAAARIHTLRAARLLEVALERRADHDAPVLPLDAPPRSDAEDGREANALEEALALPSPSASKLPTLLRALREHAPEIRRLSAELEARQRASPAQRRADLLRRAAVVALVALALWLYLRGGK